MSSVKNRRGKKRAGYEEDVPRCFNCVSYRKPKKSAPRCDRFGFPVSENGVCDHWVGLDGSVLEIAPLPVGPNS